MVVAAAKVFSASSPGRTGSAALSARAASNPDALGFLESLASDGLRTAGTVPSSWPPQTLKFVLSEYSSGAGCLAALQEKLYELQLAPTKLAARYAAHIDCQWPDWERMPTPPYLEGPRGAGLPDGFSESVGEVLEAVESAMGRRAPGDFAVAGRWFQMMSSEVSGLRARVLGSAAAGAVGDDVLSLVRCDVSVESVMSLRGLPQVSVDPEAAVLQIGSARYRYARSGSTPHRYERGRLCTQELRRIGRALERSRNALSDKGAVGSAGSEVDPAAVQHTVDVLDIWMNDLRRSQEMCGRVSDAVASRPLGEWAM